MKKRESTTSSLTGWSDVIRQEGERSRAREEERKKAAKELLASTRPLALEARLRALLTAHDEGTIRANELFKELREAVGLPGETDDE